jgi:hypothetical protein
MLKFSLGCFLFSNWGISYRTAVPRRRHATAQQAFFWAKRTNRLFHVVPVFSPYDL